MSNPSVAQTLPAHYHKFLVLFDRNEIEKLPDNQCCNQNVGLLGPEDKVRMGLINQISLEEEKLLIKSLDTMIN
jgi:hypothetical protein